MKKWDRQDGVRKEMRPKKYILIEGAIMGITKNMVLEKFSRIHKDDPSKTQSNREKGT